MQETEGYGDADRKVGAGTGAVAHLVQHLFWHAGAFGSNLQEKCVLGERG